MISLPGVRIQRAGRFIGQQNRGPVHQRPRDCDALTLAAGKLVWLVMHALFQIDLAQRCFGALNAFAELMPA